MVSPIDEPIYWPINHYNIYDVNVFWQIAEYNNNLFKLFFFKYTYSII